MSYIGGVFLARLSSIRGIGPYFKFFSFEIPVSSTWLSTQLGTAFGSLIKFCLASSHLFQGQGANDDAKACTAEGEWMLESEAPAQHGGPGQTHLVPRGSSLGLCFPCNRSNKPHLAGC